MIKKWIVVSLGIILLTGHIFGQQEPAVASNQEKHITNIDELIQEFQELKLTDPKKALSKLEKAKKMASDHGNKKYGADILLCYCEFYTMQGKYVEGADFAQKAQKVYLEINYTKGVASSFSALGKVNLLSGNYESSLLNYLSAADLYETINDSLGLTNVYHNIGGIHFDQGNNGKALEYWHKSLELELALKDSFNIISSLNAIGGVYYQEKKFEEALNMMHQSLKLAEILNDSSEMTYVLFNIGATQQQLNRLDSAQFYYQLSLVLLKQQNMRRELAFQYANYGRFECDLGNGEKAIAYFDSSLTIGKELNSPFIKKQAYGGLADANKLSGNYQEAFEWLDKWYAIKDSLNGQELKIQLAEIQEKYETEQKDKEIAIWKQKELISSATAEKRKIWLIYTISIAVSLILLIVLYIGQKRARIIQKRAELEHRALRTQMNPHFIFNSLGAIQQMYISGETDLANNYMGDFARLMRKILDSSGQERISVKEELHMLSLYLELEKGRNTGRIEYQIDVDEKIDQMGTEIPPMVIQPFIENAIWHGILPSKKSGNIHIQLKLSENQKFIACTIEDNGVGMKASQNKKKYDSKGIMITEQRLNSKVHFTNLHPGTRVSFNIAI